MSDAAPWAIDVRGLSKQYGGRTVVDRVDLRVRQGRICGFLGPNGSGKTTTIRMLCGLLTPDAGEGTCLGFDIRREAQAIAALNHPRVCAPSTTSATTAASSSSSWSTWRARPSSSG